MNDLIVIGGGLSGLAAATYAARKGCSVLALERTHELGGRARTTLDGAGFALNFGPHALYAGGAGVGVLRELGVPIRGAIPATSGLLGIANGTLHTLPGGLLSLLSTDLLSFGGKLDAARVLASIARIDTAALADTSLRAWLDAATRRDEVRHVLAAIVRVATYSNAPDVESAGAALAQVKRAIANNVLYLDGGWQSLVDGLAAAAREAGVRIVIGSPARAIVRDAYGRVGGVALDDGTTVSARAIIVAGSPGTLRTLVGDTDLGTHAHVPQPIRAACLDLGLASLPLPKRRFALGIDAPYYFSVHSATARLANDDGAVIHVAKYLDPSATPNAKRDERELEGVMDLVQPGWREVVIARRHLPSITVAHARVAASNGGRRVPPSVAQIPSLFVAGDWIDGEGMLADTALSSARDAAALAVASLGVSDGTSTMAAQ